MRKNKMEQEVLVLLTTLAESVLEFPLPMNSRAELSIVCKIPTKA